ncbi:MAG: asparagine synthase (glutamine-hydrolyzing) [Xanthobacteraceae bacterium]
MCGICGEISWDGNVSVSALQAMTASMRTRGPDAEGHQHQQNLGFGHRRLSIIDLAPTSQQPMIDPHLGVGIVFNGCIYNYRELKSELSARGYQFFSGGDTEVILKAYHAWGPLCVERLKGMFAFAVWERDSGRVVLARDRLGIKPLYWARSPHAFRFASTLPALLAAGDVDTTIDAAALHHYMSFHAVVPRDMTILNGVRRLPAATLMVIEPDGSCRQHRYWKVHFGSQQGDERLTETDWRDALSDVLAKAVERRQIADVPVGVLLSGGLDSSLIVALLARAGRTSLETFSIGFESIDDVKGDEFGYSDLIADQFHTTHHRIEVGSNRAVDALPGVISAMSEPMMSHDAIGFYADSTAATPIDKVLHLDTEIMLVDDPVKRVDNMTMAWGLEARVPFLDHEVVELAARVPSELKVRNGGKHILKDASRDIVPSEIIDRRKGYFPVPGLRYLRGPFLDFVRDVLNEPVGRQRDIFNRSYVDRLLADPEGELTPKGHSKLWQVAVLEAWLQSHDIN